MNLTKRIISSALVLSMATLTIPVEAYATSNTIKGQVTNFDFCYSNFSRNRNCMLL